MAQEWFDPAGFFLAVTDRRPDRRAGAGLPLDQGPPMSDPDRRARRAAGPIGEIYVLGVDPRPAIRGLGAPLTEIGLDYLRRRGP